MKSFIATTLAASTMAATETLSWTGPRVTGTVTCTPKGQSSYDGTKSDITVTYKTTATLDTPMVKDNLCQAWWCDNISTSNVHCHLWQFEQKDGKTEIKGRVYAGTGNPNISDKNAKDFFDGASGTWPKNTEYNVKKTGTAASTEEKKIVGLYTGVKASTVISGKTATGVFTRKYTGADATAQKKGKSAAGYIGAYNGKKGASKSATIGVKKATISAAKETKGAKKTWTGPSVTAAGNTVSVGGYTEWTKNTTAGDATHALQSWMCQTITATTALAGKNNASVWLNDKAAEPTVELWEVNMKDDKLKLRAAKLTKSFAPKDGDKKFPKDVVDEGKETMHDNYVFSTGILQDASEFESYADITKISVNSKDLTACSKSFDSDKTRIATFVKGSTKTYQQGVFYTDDDVEDSKVTLADVSVVIAAEGGASSILTTLGAVVVGVAALAF